jgi:hypothetical protein
MLFGSAMVRAIVDDGKTMAWGAGCHFAALVDGHQQPAPEARR